MYGKTIHIRKTRVEVETFKIENMKDLFELTPKQKAAFLELKKAYKKCEKAGILFYNNYGSIGALDSKKMDDYNDDSSGIPDRGQNTHNELRTNLISWADDSHYFHPV